MSASTTQPRKNARIGALIAAACVLLFVAGFLVLFAGAQVDYATGGLVVASGSLIYALVMLFRMVQALSRPAGELRSRSLGGVSRAKLREEKRRLLRAINELTFDFEMGKLSKTDYEDVRKNYELRAVDVMRELDGSSTVHPEVTALLEERGIDLAQDSSKDVAEKDSDEDAALTKAAEETAAKVAAEQDEAATKAAEAALARSESDPSDVEPKGASDEGASESEADESEADVSEDDVSEDDADEGSSSVEATCSACGGKNDVDAKFCKHCGKEMTA